MPKPFKLAILRACHDTDAAIDHAKHIEDGPFIEMVQTGGRSLLKYWTENTDGYLDFNESVIFPWVRIPLSLVDVASLATRSFRVLRETQLGKAYTATKAINDSQDLVGFDGFVLFTFPGDQHPIANPLAGQPGEPATLSLTFDAGAAGLMGKPACVLTVMASNHTFMCHEIGHVLGFEHTYGVWNNGVDWDGMAPWDQGHVYGDPYDIFAGLIRAASRSAGPEHVHEQPDVRRTSRDRLAVHRGEPDGPRACQSARPSMGPRGASGRSGQTDVMARRFEPPARHALRRVDEQSATPHRHPAAERRPARARPLLPRVEGQPRMGSRPRPHRR